MKNDAQLTALVARGEDIERDIVQAMADPNPNVKTRIHIDEVRAWYRDARSYLQGKSPSLLQQVPEFAATADHEEIYSAIRRMIAVLTSLVPAVVGSKAADFLTPASFIAAARNAHPAFRYAIAIAGILAIVVIFARYGVDYATLVFGAFTLVVLMVLFVVFAQAAKLAKARMALPATVLVWAFLAVSIGVPVMLVTSAFWNGPLPLKDWIIRRLNPQTDAAAGEVERKIKGFLAANSLPVPGKRYTDEQLAQQFRLIRDSQGANFTYPILSGYFVRISDDQDSYSRSAALKDGKVVGVLITQSCSIEASCAFNLEEWRSFVESAFGDPTERSSDAVIFGGPGVNSVPATSKLTTGYGQPWNVLLSTQTPRVAGAAKSTVSIVIATSSS